MFEGRVIRLAGLALIELPARTIRLCDGGYVYWGADKFTAKDDEFGTLANFESNDDAIGEEAPGGRLTLLPPEATAAGTLAQPEAQGGAVQLWMAELDNETGLISGTPQMVFDGVIDTVTLRLTQRGREVVIGFVAQAERLFAIKEGNVLSTRFHQLAWPGEKGLDHCTGAQVAVPWGVPDPGRGTGFFGNFINIIRDRRTAN